MTITALPSNNGEILTIKVEGRFDFSSLQMFRHAYENIEVKPSMYVVDLKESDYLDSSALGILLALRDHAGGDEANIRIVNATADIRKILVITKLDELFELD
jgi:HptB-dependent secretion and biofilm anti anti-sigma factor